MNSFEVNHEKASAILRYRRRQRITNLFRFIELVIFMIAISRFSLPVAFKFPGDCFRGVSGNVFSPGFVFVLGNVIVLVLLLKAGGHYSSPKLDPSKEDIPEPKTKEVTPMKMNRSQSEIFKREKLADSGRKLRRSVTETRRKVVNKEEEMSGEEFRRTVEAFIARQQKILREEVSEIPKDFCAYEKRLFYPS